MIRKHWFFFALALVAFSACGSNGFDFARSSSGVETTLTVTGTPGETPVGIQPGTETPIQGSDDSGGVTVAAGNEPPTTEPGVEEPSPPKGGGSESPSDGSGCFVLRAIATGVSAAWVKLNGEEVLAPSEFHNTDVVLNRDVSLNEGNNVLELRIAGSPADSLKVQIWNCTEDPSVLLFEKELVRTTGKPASSSDGL